MEHRMHFACKVWIGWLFGAFLLWGQVSQAQTIDINKVFDNELKEEIKLAMADSANSIFRTPIRGLSVYESNIKLFGQLTVGHQKAIGKGLLSVTGALLRCDEMIFKSTSIDCPNGKFLIKSNNPSKPTLEVNRVSVVFDFEKRMTKITSLTGEDPIAFPNQHYSLTFNEFEWSIDSTNLHVYAIKDSLGQTIPIKVHSTNLLHGGLNFEGEGFYYDFYEHQVKMHGVAQIPLSHVHVKPADGHVTILDNGHLDTLKNAEVVFNTTQDNYHAFSKGNIVIRSKHHFDGIGMYEFENHKGERQSLEIKNFNVSNYSLIENNQSIQYQETTVESEVPHEKHMEIIPGMRYSGKLKLSTHKHDFDFHGQLTLDIPGRPHVWFPYAGSGGHDIRISENLKTADGRLLEAGLFLSKADKHLHQLFVEHKQADAWPILQAKGYLSYKPSTGLYSIKGANNLNGILRTLEYEYAPSGDKSFFRGDLMLNESDREFNMRSVGVGTFEASGKFMANAAMELTFKPNRKAFEMLAAALQQGGHEPIAYAENPKELYFNLEQFISQAEMAILKNTAAAEWNLLSTFANSMLLTNVQLQWAGAQNAFYSTGKIGVSNLFRMNVNALVDGHVYIPLDNGFDELHIYLKSGENWYYLKRKGEYMSGASSDPNFNDALTKGRQELLSPEEVDRLLGIYKQLTGK